MANYLHFLPEPLLDDIVFNRSIPIGGAGFSRNALRFPLATEWSDRCINFSVSFKLLPGKNEIVAQI